MDNHKKNPYAYLSYVTLGEMWKESKRPFLKWAIFAGVILALGIFGAFGVNATPNALCMEDSPILPLWAWRVIAVIIFLAMLWGSKGAEIKITFPATFNSWLFLTFLGGLIFAFFAASFPWWVALPFSWSILIVFDMWEEGKHPFLGWAILSGVFLALGILSEFGANETKNTLCTEDAPILPSWAWGAIMLSALLWISKGEEVKFYFPTTVKSILLLTFFLSGEIIAFNAASFPWWVGMPFLWGILLVAGVLGALADKGRENYSKLTNSSNENN